MPSEDPHKLFTYETRLTVDPSSHEVLKSVAELLSRVERSLFADLCAGKKANDLKSAYLQKFGITARQFNAIRVQVEGKIAARKETLSEQILTTEQKLASVTKSIQKLGKRAPHSDKLHQKKRYLFNLEKKLKSLKAEQQSGRVTICFGSKRLFRAQFDLEANGYKTHDEWLEEWRFARSSSFFLLGSKDESSGNQSCTATVVEDGSLSVRLRLPDSIAKNGDKYLTFSGIRFAYGHETIVAALALCKERKLLQKCKDPAASFCGVPVTYRFKCDKKGWRLLVTVPRKKTPVVTSHKGGVIGVDINADLLAVAETDRFGNPVAKKTVPLCTYGKDRNQTAARIGDACAIIVHTAKCAKKPLVIETLNFQKKKAELREQSGPKHARMLSSFVYGGIINALKARAYREGVEVFEVNPAYSSVIGRVKFCQRYGFSTHQGAALTIGRRFLQASERIPRNLEKIPDGKGGHVALSLPVRNRDKHVWSQWARLNRELKTVLAAHFRAKHNRSSSTQPARETDPIPNFAGGIPAREFVDKTARSTCLHEATSTFA